MTNSSSTFTMPSLPNYLEQAFSRNLGLLSRAEMVELRHSTVAIPGLGGVGGSHLNTLVRTGIGSFKLADFDSYEPANVNRQIGARLSTFGKPKIQCAAADAKDINPSLNLSLFEDGVTEDNLDDFLDGVDIVVDSLDFFVFDIRRKLFTRARELGIPVVTAGPVGFSAAMLIFMPNQGMTFDEYFNINDKLDQDEKIRRFTVGLAPNPKYFEYVDFRYLDLENKRGPSLGLACQLCAASAATEVIRILLNRGPAKAVPYYHQYDPYLRTFRLKYLPFGNKNPWQKFKISLFRKKKHQLTKEKQRQVNAPVAPKPGIVSDEAINYIIDAGIEAPSGDNVQPWKFDIIDSTINIFLDPSKDLSFFNFRQMASILSCGAVMENIKHAATALDLQCDIKLLADPSTPELMASVTLSPGETPDTELASCIWKRRTNRKAYRPKPALKSSISRLREAAKPFSETTSYFITDSADLARFQKAAWRCDRIRQELKGCHEHLFSMLRWTAQSEQSSADGLPIKSLEAGFMGETMLRLLRPWSIANFANKLGTNYIIAQKATDNCKAAGGIGLISVKEFDNKSVIQAGQAFQRIWLECTALDLYLHPCAMPPILFQYLKAKETNYFTTKQIADIELSLKEIAKLFPESAKTSEWPLMFFRIGESTGPSKTTIRKHRDNLITSRTSTNS